MAGAGSYIPKKGINTILAPTASKKLSDFEYSVHECPKTLCRELKAVFPAAKINETTTLYIVPTFQKSSLPLLEFGEQQASEKDRLLERFLDWGRLVRDAVHRLDAQAWVEITDAASGLPYFGDGNVPYSDVMGVQRTMGYDCELVGGCVIVRHPVWTFSVYPGKQR